MTTSMAPITPVIPMLRAPGRAGADHQVRVDGRPICGERINPETWVVIAADRARNRCVNCDRETA